MSARDIPIDVLEQKPIESLALFHFKPVAVKFEQGGLLTAIT